MRLSSASSGREPARAALGGFEYALILGEEALGYGFDVEGAFEGGADIRPAFERAVYVGQLLNGGSARQVALDYDAA